MGAPTIRKRPTTSLPPKDPDPRHAELFQKHRDKKQNKKVVRSPR